MESYITSNIKQCPETVAVVLTHLTLILFQAPIIMWGNKRELEETSERTEIESLVKNGYRTCKQSILAMICKEITI